METLNSVLDVALVVVFGAGAIAWVALQVINAKIKKGMNNE